MKDGAFIINNRFVIDIERSELLDNTTNEKNRLEPRLMKLLYMLVQQQGNVVKREFIISEIWDNYPGANEGLNQAISFLRKLLADEHKSVIQTLPKSGYSFNATVLPVIENKPFLSSKLATLIIGVLVLIIAVFSYLRKTTPAITTGDFNERNGAAISKKDSIHQIIQQQKFLEDTLGRAAMGDSLRKSSKQGSLRESK